ncbi:MAG: hypothetical protein ACRDKE_03210, partial [Solirubrobacterales bacterium]
MNVLLLGAGASKGAGYPPASDLMTTIEDEVGRSSDEQSREAWREWCAFRDRVTGPLQLLLCNPNPEVIFSLLDLYEEALGSHDDEELAQGARALRLELQGAATNPSSYWDSEERRALFEGKVARNRLLYCLAEYFETKHCEDDRAEERGRRDYLRHL